MTILCGVRMRRDTCYDLIAFSVMELSILFEYKGSRKPLGPIKRECVVELIQEELVRYGDTAAVVQLVGEGSTDGSAYLLQKWSDVWSAYIDVEEIDDLEDKDKVTVVPKPTFQQPSSTKVS